MDFEMFMFIMFTHAHNSLHHLHNTCLSDQQSTYLGLE